MPQSQTAANPRHHEEEKKDKNIYARNKQTNKCTRSTKASSLFPKRDDQNAEKKKEKKKRRNEDTEHDKTLKH